jgi:hypothetical protein
MGLADDMAKLDELRRSGALSEAEFQEAASALFSHELGSSEPARTHNATGQGSDIQYTTELARIDSEWQRDERYYLVRSVYRRRVVPTTTMAGYLIFVGGGIGVLWVMLTVALLRSIPAAGPLAQMRMFFPLLGVVYTVFVVGYGLYCYRRARLYQERYQAYRARRQSIRPEDFR